MIKKRKISHLNLATDPDSQNEINYWDQINLPYSALPEKNFESVSTSVTFLNKELSLPVIIGAITFPVNGKSRRLNRNLVRLAEEKSLAFNIGSQRIMIERDLDQEAEELRRLAPKACLMANFGAVQLNYGWGIDQARRCVETLEADALVLHLNLLQELIQPRGDIDFSGLAEKISRLVKKLPVPVIVKEVGFGIDPQTAKKLYSLGVYAIDVAGQSGTNWAKIEASRRRDNWADPFKSIGWPAPELTQEVARLKPKDKLVIASGGIRTGLDIARAIYLGADLVSISQPFFLAGLKGYSYLLKLYRRLAWQYKVSLMILNDKSS